MDKKKMDIERRFSTDIELRIADDGKVKKIVGYAAVFNILSEEIFGFKEKILPGAFKKSLAAGDDVRALVDHDSTKILGRRSADTLEVKEDKKGLYFDIDLPDTQAGRDIQVSVERGDVTGASFGFKTITDAWHIEDEQEIRELIEVKLIDVSPVTYPAYPDTTVGLRSRDEWREEQKNKQEQEQENRDDLTINESLKMRLEVEESK